MANDEHVAMLKKGVDAWNVAWRRENPDIRPDLDGAELSNASLARANLARANLFEADLVGANLKGTDLFEADLVGANLKGANLNGDLSGANLSGGQSIRLPSRLPWWSPRTECERTTAGVAAGRTILQPVSRWQGRRWIEQLTMSSLKDTSCRQNTDGYERGSDFDYVRDTYGGCVDDPAVTELWEAIKK